MSLQADIVVGSQWTFSKEQRVRLGAWKLMGPSLAMFIFGDGVCESNDPSSPVKELMNSAIFSPSTASF